MRELVEIETRYFLQMTDMKEGEVVDGLYLMIGTCLSRLNGEDENHKKGDHQEEGEAWGRENNGRTLLYCRYSQPAICSLYNDNHIMMNGWEGCKVRLDSPLGFYCATEYLF